MSRFGDEARKRQACFRTISSTISPGGRSPKDDKGLRHGHLLAHGFEHENLYPSLRGEDGALKFFEEREIKWHRSHRSGDTPGGEGPTRNMASSQVACVNFLLPLLEIPGALTAVARAIDDDVVHIVPIYHECLESQVEFEWIGLRPLEEGAAPTRGANVTSVDAFMIGRTSAGLRAYLIEWKYTEDYPVGADKGKGKPGETRRGRYAPLYCADYSSFNGRIPMDELLYEPFYQIMRLRLLADRMVKNRELGISDAKVVVVVPNGNTAYRDTITSPGLPDLGTVEEVVRATLKEPDRAFATISPEDLLSAVERECGDSTYRWATYQRERYGGDA